MGGLKTLLIDNLDSYTYNLFQLIAEVNQGKLQRGCRLAPSTFAAASSLWTAIAAVPRRGAARDPQQRALARTSAPSHQG